MQKRNNGDVIIEYLKKNPGKTAQQIVAGTGLPLQSVKQKAVDLVREGTLVRRQQPNAHGIGRQEFVYSYNHKYVAKPTAAVPPKSELPATGVPAAKDPAMQIHPADTLDKKVADLVEAILARITDEVRAGLAREVPKIVDEVRAGLAREVPKIVDEVTQTYVHPKEKPKLRKVMVCGVLQKQHADFEEEFDGVCDLVFAGVDDAPNVWRSRAANAYAVILWTNFVSHKHSEYLTSAGIKPVLVTGGLTAVKDKIMEVCI